MRLPIPKVFDDMNKSIKEIEEHQAKKAAQPFITNDILEDLLKSQTPRGVNYIILVVSSLALFVGLIALLHSYEVI